MMWGGHGDGWWWFVVMPLAMLLFWSVVVWVVATLVRANRPAESPRPPEDALRILDARYARGEIDRRVPPPLRRTAGHVVSNPVTPLGPTNTLLALS